MANVEQDRTAAYGGKAFTELFARLEAAGSVNQVLIEGDLVELEDLNV
jgi:hypothetical protein